MNTPSSQSRGRPRGYDLDQILDRALELFWKRGYETTTTRDLEHALGLKQSSLYHQFGSKQQLLNLALDRYEDQTKKAVLQELQTAQAGLDSIEQFYEKLSAWVTRDGRRGCLLINMMAEDGDRSQAITARTRRYRRDVRHALKNQLKIAARDGQISSNSLEERANLLLALVLGFNIAARGGASAAELKAMRDSVRVQIQAWRN